jgi:hypothetical protein
LHEVIKLSAARSLTFTAPCLAFSTLHLLKLLPTAAAAAADSAEHPSTHSPSKSRKLPARKTAGAAAASGPAAAAARAAEETSLSTMVCKQCDTSTAPQDICTALPIQEKHSVHNATAGDSISSVQRRMHITPGRKVLGCCCRHICHTST